MLLLVAATAAPASAQSAAGPFTVHRANSPALAASVVLHAQTAVAPFDDDAGTLSDGESYFYVVKDAAGIALPLSARKNVALDTVRLGFDDGDAASAQVDSLASRVKLSTASFPADGASMAIVTVLPVDTAGVLLGSGLSVSVDASALFPGTVPQPISDLGDGSYSFAVLSSVPGSGTVVVDVEGTTLASQPVVVYELVGSSICGDGFVDTANFESCDDGNTADDDACPSTCETAFCGDGFVWAGVEECDGGPSCNSSCQSSTCGVNGSLNGCSPANALWVLIDELEARIDADPSAPLAVELQVIVGHLTNARDALTQPSPDPDQAKSSINLAIGHLDEAVAAGLGPLYAWIKALQLVWISGQI